jgi:apolipoprotein N-acyltransferase
VKRKCAVAAAIASGGLLVLSFPKFGIGALAWVALVPLLYAILRLGGRWAGRLSYVSGVVASVGLLYWTALVVVQYGGLSGPLGVALMVLLCLVLALYYGLFGALVGLWLRALGPQAILLAAFAWVAVEWLRVEGPLAFPWCLLGYSQADALVIAQVASVTGVYGLSFLVVAAGSVVAYVLIEQRPRRRFAAIAGLALVALVVGLFGRHCLATPLPESGRLRVGLAQAAVPQDEKWDERLAARNLSWHVALTRQAAARGAELVVWPESAVPYYFDSSPDVASDLRQLAAETRAWLLFGNDDFEGGPADARVFVGAKLLAPDGQVALRYHKMQLVPFGEYVPFERLLGALGVKKLVEQVGTFTPGETPVVGQCAGHGVSVTICYEAIFPSLVRRFAASGAELLANVTNDAWYGRTSAPYQHFAMARLRAVENGRSFVRAANTGVSALIDPRGRVLARTLLFERTVLVGDVPLVQRQTFYARHGDVFAWVCVAATMLISAHAWRRRRGSGRA